MGRRKDLTPVERQDMVLAQWEVNRLRRGAFVATATKFSVSQSCVSKIWAPTLAEHCDVLVDDVQKHSNSIEQAERGKYSNSIEQRGSTSQQILLQKITNLTTSLFLLVSYFQKKSYYITPNLTAYYKSYRKSYSVLHHYQSYYRLQILLHV
jgi:hypothetical protein